MTEREQTKPLGWTDAGGNWWSTRLDVPAVARLKSEGYDIKDNQRLAAIFDDPYEAADFAAAVHRTQWEERGMSEVEFLVAITDTETRLGEVIAATVEGLIDFFLRFRDALRAGIVKKAVEASLLSSQAIEEKLQSEKVNQALEATLARRSAEVDANLDRIISGEISGDSLASSESHPQVLPFERYSPRSKGSVSHSGTTPPPS